MRRKRSLVFSVILLCLSGALYAQPWSGIIAPSRAINWSNAGLPGGIAEPTVQCGPTIAPYGSSGAPASAATINTAIQNCPPGEYVSLGAGTFYLNSFIQWWATNLVSNVVLRGQGANSTFLVFSGNASGGSLNSDIAMEGSSNSPISEQNVCDWTAGYSQGTTVITLANCGSTTPAVGSLSNLKVGSLLILDQVDEPADTGTVWNCATNAVCANSGTGGFTRNSGPCANGVCWRSQAQGVIVTAISGSQITISPGLYMSNWRSGQLPQAWFALPSPGTITGDGLENLSIDNTNVTGSGHNIHILDCYGCWISGVRSIDAARSHVELYMAWHSTVKNSYFYQSQSHSAVSYGIELEYAWDNLIENNICQQVTDSCPNTDGAAEGNVYDYNFAIDSIFTSAGWFQASFYDHASGDAMNLREGNIGTGWTADDIHGTHEFETAFRNRLPGWQLNCDGAACAAQTDPLQLYAGTRYFNIIGNVLGQTGFHNTYECDGSASNHYSNTAIYILGATGNGCNVDTSYDNSYCLNPSCTSKGNYDPQVASYMMRWGNYDTVHAAPQWNSSEVPTSLASYSNAVPSSKSLPASFYYSSQPSWWTSGLAWPPIGPDVSGGTLGRCSGGTYAGVLATSSSQCTGGTLVTDAAGEANPNPAMSCFLNVIGGPPDGSGSVLSFNASSCYSASAAQAPAPPTSLTVIIH